MGPRPNIGAFFRQCHGHDKRSKPNQRLSCCPSHNFALGDFITLFKLQHLNTAHPAWVLLASLSGKPSSTQAYSLPAMKQCMVGLSKKFSSKSLDWRDRDFFVCYVRLENLRFLYT